MSEWINVKDRLPEHEDRYLVINGMQQYIMPFKFNGVGLGYWECGYRFHSKANDVTHWMPLPEPPKEAQNA